MGRPAVETWRGERISFPEAQVFSPSDPDLSPAIARAVKEARRRPIAVDLFSGAGGLSLGLQESGFFVLLGADSDRIACETHASTMEGVTVRANLARSGPLREALRRAGVNHVDLVAGG